MNEMERQGRFIEAQRAQSGLTIPEALEMLRNDGQARPPLEFGLEIAGAGSPDDATPAEMSEIDPGWASYLVRQEEAADAPWLAAAGSLEDAALAKGRLAYQTAAEDSEVLAAALGVLSNAGPLAYQQFLGEVADDDSDYAQALAQTVSNTMGEWSQHVREQDFQAEFAESERLNVADAAAAIDAVAERRGMTRQDVERATRAYWQATGQPLRSSLLSVMPEQRQRVHAGDLRGERGRRARRPRKVRGFKMAVRWAVLAVRWRLRWFRGSRAHANTRSRWASQLIS